MFTTKNLFKLAGKHFLIALGSIAIALVVISFLSNQITSISNKTAKDRNVAESLSDQTTRYANLKNETALIGSNDKIIKNAFIPSDNILGFVAALEALALKNGLTESFHFSGPSSPVTETSFPTETIVFQNNITSDLQTLINYLKGFENLPYFTKIDSINISSGSTDWKSSAIATFSASVVAQITK